MDFIQFIIIFTASFILFRFVISSIFELDNHKVEEKCTLHKWEYGEDGRMFCTKCKKKALDD